MGKAPSRKRYEENNPVVAFRVSKEIKEDLDDLVDKLDTTKKEWFEGFVANDEEDVSEAWDNGYEAGKEEFQLEVPCVICEEPVPVLPEDYSDVADILWGVAHDEYDDIDWWYGHEDCI